jgi:nucleotide-binding universal stress UspA family protein
MRVLLAVDHSKYSEAAIKEVETRPWPARSTVRVLSVVEPLPPPAAELWFDGRGSLDLAHKELRQRAGEFVKRIVTRLKKKRLRVEAAVRDGHPRTVIVDEARKWSADLIVLGSHGRTGLKRLLLGSVAASVVGHAPCSVEVVRSKRGKNR